MKSPSTARPPIVEFLGEDAGVGGPFALLGLPHEIPSADRIIRARNRRLHQIARHQHRSTPDANEVRLAVHAAASQLLDPELRIELARRWPAGVEVSLPKAWKSNRASPRLAPAVVSNAKRIIAASGGWNEIARHRLAHFARMNRVGAVELVEAISPAYSSASPPNGVHADGAPPAIRERMQLIDPPPTAGSAQWIIAYGMILVMGLIVLSTVVLAPSRFVSVRSGSDVSRPSEPDAPAGATIENPLDRTQAQTLAQRQDLSHYTAIAHELDQLVVRANSEPEGSIERFATIYPLFVESWTSFPAPALERGGLHIAEFVDRVSKQQGARDAITSVFDCQPPEEVSKAMIRAAVIDVVLSEQTLPSDIRAVLVAIAKRCAGYDPRPNQHIKEAIIRIAGLEGVDARTDDPRWWASWLRAVEAASPDDEPQRTRLVLSAMSARLRDPSPPSDAWNAAIVKLVNAVTWRSDTPERFWLLSQFADEAVNTVRLAALTRALGTESGAQEITPQMVLNPSATLLQRLELAEEYRSAWARPDLASSNSDQFSGLINELHIRVSITPTRMDERQGIAAIVELARLNTAAWESDRADDTSAGESLQSAKHPIAPPPEPEQINLSVNSRDTRWAQQAINAKDAGELGVYLAELIQDDGPGANSAHALVYLATLNPSSEIRSLASAQVVRYKDKPTMLLAIDRAIGESRISTRLDQLVGKVVARPLPQRTDGSWFFQTHRAILELLSEGIARTIKTDLPTLQSAIGSTYTNRLVRSSASLNKSLDAIESARKLYQQMILEADSAGNSAFDDAPKIQAIESATAVRRARAQSPMHEFLAYQRGVCELLALRVEHDIPGSSLRVGDLLSELHARLDQSATVIDQIAQIERCIAQLWVLQLGGARP